MKSSVQTSQTTEIRKERKVHVTREYHMSSNTQQSLENFSSGLTGSSFPALRMDMDMDMDNVLQSALHNQRDLQSLLSDQMSSALNESSSSIRNQSQRTSTQSTSTHSSNNAVKVSASGSSQVEKFSEVIALGGEIGPDDLSVTLKDNVMTIEAKVQKEKRCEDGNSSSTSKMYQEFKKMFTIPSNVDINQMKTILTRDGNLKIEAPYQQKALPAP